MEALVSTEPGVSVATGPCWPKAQQQDGFDPAAWLSSFAARGGGYALTSGQKLCFLVGDCTADDLTSCMAELVGHADRLAAVKHTIERRSLGQVL